MCPYAGVFTLSQIANTNCMTTPTPTPLTGLIPGDVCSTANKDTCNAGTCTNNVCVATNKVGSTCTGDQDCPIATYCNNEATRVCAAIIAPGAACTDPSSTTNTSPQCGFNGFCVNSKCMLPLSIPNGDSGLVSTLPQASVSRLCSSGYASSTNSPNGNYWCVAPPKSAGTPGQSSPTSGNTCAITVTDAKSATSTVNLAN